MFTKKRHNAQIQKNKKWVYLLYRSRFNLQRQDTCDALCTRVMTQWSCYPWTECLCWISRTEAGLVSRRTPLTPPRRPPPVTRAQSEPGARSGSGEKTGRSDLRDERRERGEMRTGGKIKGLSTCSVLLWSVWTWCWWKLLVLLLN